MSKVHCNILLIDDDDINNYINKNFLRLTWPEAEVSEATNVTAELKKLLNDAANGTPLPDIIFLDLNMPVMNGWDFLEQVDKSPYREVFLETDIYLLTSSVYYEDIERAKKTTALSGFFSKPLTTESLKVVLQKRKERGEEV